MTSFEGFSANSFYLFRTIIARAAVVFVAVGLRFLCKIARTERRFGWDDFWILVAFVLNYIAEGLQLWALFKSRGGTPAAVLLKAGERDRVEHYLLITDINAMMWYPAVACICVSIVCFYLRIFRHETNFLLFSRILMGLITLWALGSALGSILLCIPPSNFWKMRDLDKCGSYNTVVLSSSIAEIIITTAILALPVRPIMKLTLGLRTRLSILTIFLLGAFVIVSAAIRVGLVWKPGVKTPNFQVIAIWSGIHLTAAFVCACLPMYKPIWNQIVRVSKSIVDYSSTFRHRWRTEHSSNDKGSMSEQVLTSHDVVKKTSSGETMLQEWQTWENHRY
ncbi:hypothetical protein BU24DRAFT_447199 [Aaosphaeria arxii CBS 175.79]|uniref:Rhodopsin domain-containing protein n=1 Tax=Aaosphaeria arxii CBS 175.79 TaxID=1450172 RepID=A0A6A5YA06_9PLEO|nr:uncharacterized protein BU24DRAFT_447199 [Aaosphaeria arxii CBS 175.79]KAF2022425.1 hypothetical protein BU24DRAFT_447199 [Aaosphaeria arxii CBS 175.79]